MKVDIKHRTKVFAISIIRFCNQLQKSTESGIIARQMIRSSTSVGANYRAACRAKSRADFINKLKIVEEELDETLYWLELIKELELASSQVLMRLYNEGEELLKIIVASIISTRKKSKK